MEKMTALILENYKSERVEKERKGEERKGLHVLFPFYPHKHQKVLFELLCLFSTYFLHFLTFSYETCWKKGEQKLSSLPFLVNA